MSVKVHAIYMLHRDETILFAGRRVNRLEVGPNRRDGQIPDLQMSLNEMTGLIKCDAPGFSTAVHVSKVSPVLEPAITLEAHAEKQEIDRKVRDAEAVEQQLAAQGPAPVGRTTPKTKEQLTAELGFDPNGDDLDDAEIARLSQGRATKRAIAKRTKKKPAAEKIQATVAPAPEPDYGDEESDDIDPAALAAASDD